MPETVYLSLGSNYGDSPGILAGATRMIAGQVGPSRTSRVYITKAVEDENQPDFHNLALEVVTNLSPEDLLELLQGIENFHGRARDPFRPKGPRTLDIDIVLFGSKIVHESSLEIPHPRMHARRFVLLPILELSPNLAHPVTGIALAEYAADTSDQTVYPAYELGL